MPQNKELTQEDRALIDAKIDEMVDQGAPEDQIFTVRDKLIADIKAGKQSTPETPGSPGGSDLQPATGSSESQEAEPTWAELIAKNRANKGTYYDADGEVNNLGKDFGPVGLLVEQIPFFGDVIDDMYGAAKTGRAQAKSVDDALNLFKEGAEVSDEDLQEYLKRVKDLESQGPSKEMQNFNKVYEEAGGGGLGFVKAIATNPQAAVETMASSLIAMANPASLAGAGAGAGAGALTGSVIPGIGTAIGATSGMMAGASATLDTAMSFTEFLQEEVSNRGLEFDDESIRQVLEDPKALSRIRTRAASRGAVIGLVDGLTGGIAGKVTKAGAKVGKSAAKAARKGFAIEAAGGGVGEAAGRVVAGQELDAREIGLEIVGEFGQAIPVVGAALNESTYSINDNQFSRADVEEFLNSAPAEEIANGKVKIRNDRKLKSLYNQRLSGLENIEENNSLLEQSDLDAKSDKLKNIENLYSQKSKSKSETTKKALDEEIAIERKDLKDLIKEQNSSLVGLSDIDKKSIKENNKAVQNIDEAISELTAEIQDSDNPSSIENTISNLNKRKEDLLAGTANIRSIQAEKVADKKAKAEAKQQEASQEQSVEDQAKEAGITPEEYTAQQEEIRAEADEEASDNGKVFDGLGEQLLDYGIELTPAQGAVDQNQFDNRVPLSKDSDSYALGDFEKVVKSFSPTDHVSAKKAVKQIENEAKKTGATANVEVVAGENGGEFFVEGTISAPEREAPLSDKFKPEVNPQGNVVGEKVAVDEKGPVKKRKARSKKDQEAPTAEFVNDKRYPGVKEIGPDTFELGDPKQIHKLRNDVAGRNYEVQENSDGTVTLTPGKPSFSLDESQIPSITDQIKSENPGKITHQKARRLATERLREGVREIDRVKGLNPDAEDGATFNADGTKYEGGGLVVPVTSENLTQAELTPERIQAFKEKHKDKIGPATKVGIYKFPNSDKVSIDLNIVAPSSQRERALAIGKELGQESLFDLDTFENVKTGETGQAPKQITAEQAKQFADELGAAPEFSLAEGISTEERVDLAGGKGGFGSSVDASTKSKDGGRTLDSADWLKGIEKAYETNQTQGGVVNDIADQIIKVNEIDVTGKEEKLTPVLNQFLKSNKRRLAPYGINPNWIGSKAPITKESVDRARKLFDELTGVENSWRNPDEYRNTKKSKPGSGPVNLASDELLFKLEESDYVVGSGYKTIEHQGGPTRKGLKVDKAPDNTEGIAVPIAKPADKPTGEPGFTGFDENVDTREEKRSRIPATREAAKLKKNVRVNKGFGQYKDNIDLNPNLDTKEGRAKKAKSDRAITYLNKALTPFVEYVAQGAARKGAGKDGISDVKGLARTVLSEVLSSGKFTQPKVEKDKGRFIVDENTGQYERTEGQKFEPANVEEALGQLRGFVRTAVSNHYVFGEGSPAGTTGRGDNAKTRLNKIRSAIRQIEVQEGQPSAKNIANILNEGFTQTREVSLPGTVAGNLGPQGVTGKYTPGKVSENTPFAKRRNIKDELITPEKVQELLDAETQFQGDLGATSETGETRIDNALSDEGVDVNDALDNLRSRNSTGFAKSLGISPNVISELKETIQDVVNDTTLSESQKDGRIGQLVGAEIDPGVIEKNINSIVKAATNNDIPKAKNLKSVILDEYLNNTKRAKPKRDLRNFVGKLVGAEIEGTLIADRAGKITPSPEFSLENRNPKFSGFEFDAGRTTSQRVEAAVKPFLQNSKRNLRGDKFSSVLTHRSPEKKAAVKRAAREVGANIVDHPLNPGEVLVLPQGKTLNDILKFNTSKNGKAIDLDPRDFTTFNENAKPDARQYTNLNINDLINNINSRGQYVNNISNWGKLNKIAQLQPRDINNIKRSLTEQGFNVEESVDAKGDPTIVFSKGRINPQWSLKDVHAPSKEQASPEYIKSVSKALQNAFPNVDVISSQEGFNNAVNELQRAGHYLPAGVKGMQYANKVVINPSIATKDTPIHEFGHIWASQLQKTNPKLWKRGVELLKGSPYMRVVADIPHYKAYLKESPSKFYEEVMANALGKRGAEIFARNTEKAGAWDNFMKKVGNWVKDKLNIASEKDYADLTLDDWLNIGASSILTGDQTAFKAPTSKEAISYNLGEHMKSPENKTKAKADEIVKKAAERADKRKTKIQRLKDWIVPPSSDDFHGLIERFKERNPKSEVGKKLDNLIKTYEDNYHTYEQNATKVREDVKGITDRLTKRLGIKSKNLPEYLNKETNTKLEGDSFNATISELLSNYNNDPNAKAYIDNNKILSDLYNDLNNIQVGTAKFKLKNDGPFQAQVIDFINKELLNESLKDFHQYKSDNFSDKKDIASMGSSYLKAFDGTLDRMSGHTGRGSDAITTGWSKWLQGSVGVVMFLNVRSAGLQMLSTWNFQRPGNFFQFNRDLAATLVKGSPQRKMFTDLWNDPMLKERRARAGFDVNAEEILDAVKAGSFNNFIGKGLNKGFVLTSYMDSVAIASGGVGFIRDQQSQGKTLEQAKSEWRKQTQEAQQSARPDRVSEQQKASVSKFILAFANTPQQYFRLSQKAFRVVKEKGPMSPEGLKAIRKIGFYMVAQNAIFTMLQSASDALFTGWDSDDEDERKQAEDSLNSMSDTFLRGLGLWGASVSAIKNGIFHASREADKANPDYARALTKGATSLSPPLQKKLRAVEEIGNAYKYDKGEKGARSAHAIAASRAGTLANLPTDWLQKKLAAVQRYAEDAKVDFTDLLWMLGGYSEYSVLKGKEDDLNFDDLDFDDLDVDDLDVDDLN